MKGGFLGEVILLDGGLLWFVIVCFGGLDGRLLNILGRVFLGLLGFWNNELCELGLEWLKIGILFWGYLRFCVVRSGL